MVTQLGNIKFIVDASTQCGDDCLNFIVFQHLVQTCFFHIEDLAAQRQDGLVHGVTAGFCGATSGVTLHDVEFGFHRVFGATVGKFTGQATKVGGGLAPHQVAGFAGCQACLGGGDRLGDNGFCFRRVRFKPVCDVLVGHALHKGTHFGVAQFGFGLALELRIGHTHGNDSCESFAAVFAGEVGFFFLQHAVFASVAVHQRGQRRTEAFFVSAAFNRVDGVGKGMHALRIAGVPLHGDFHLVFLTFCFKGNDGGVDGGFGLVQ